MLSILDAIILGILQGITEFFPISSSGHLVLGQELLGLEAPELTDFNVLVHVATLFAVVFYFRQQLIDLFKGLIKKDKEQIKLFWGLALGTVPAVLVAFTLKDAIEGTFLTSKPVLAAMLCTGLFFLAAEYFKTKSPSKNNPSIINAILIGVAQAVALIPGVSRSGSTLATGLFLKLDREKSAEFSFLLAIPAIAGAGLFTALDYTPNPDANYMAYLVGFAAALLAGYFSIAFLMKLYKRHSLNTFAFYLIALFIVGQIFI